jgi:hypothetical protein
MVLIEDDIGRMAIIAERNADDRHRLWFKQFPIIHKALPEASA